MDSSSTTLIVIEYKRPPSSNRRRTCRAWESYQQVQSECISECSLSIESEDFDTFCLSRSMASLETTNASRRCEHWGCEIQNARGCDRSRNESFSSDAPPIRPCRRKSADANDLYSGLGDDEDSTIDSSLGEESSTSICSELSSPSSSYRPSEFLGVLAADAAPFKPTRQDSLSEDVEESRCGQPKGLLSPRRPILPPSLRRHTCSAATA